MKIQEYSHLNILLNIPEFQIILPSWQEFPQKKAFYKHEIVCLWLGVTILLKHFSTKMIKFISITVFFMCK